ncbi:MULTISPECIES: DUF5954 family protein [Streptomycetaceae]|uniref:PE-PGRS family protein n=1 Tax=Streptantibioticus cattleyicolor (strain ATCC 35852 / DSM 46488 / JCM 4925 / NBRC 14057 / NRRL 8057) TaxID=1003195 RepID=F8JU33_STREN|nr:MULTISPECIES: DUF5954 family protein [Streptomycetaceae]AEW93045.1 hypothetical protein SCATT_06740 [Streptantibioticus cattleyicolor NRRL 8057 = DSM 46488]MYS57778.1 hypothetical protein [Streptomyces sp. SID5468]CCB73403.1 conserved protein of unknown function [Streptantibioticus cattleyicolor NRRL 8057 = DSM 46488]
MTFSRGDVPEHLTIRITQASDPVSAVTEDDAWRALDAYPEVVVVGPVFGLAELPAHRDGCRHWRVIAAGEPSARSARRRLHAHLLRLAEDAAAPADRAAYAAAAEPLAGGAADEVAAGAHRFRVIRADAYARTGPDGPEPPRPTDPDGAPAGQGHRAPDRTAGFVIDPAAATGPSGGLLRLELLPLVHPPGRVHEDVRADADRALATHPGGVLLPTGFSVAEETGGRWRTLSCPGAGPQSARDHLARYVRALPGGSGGEYEAAARRLGAERCDEVRVCGRRFRVVRVEQLVRVGPDGPEPPRPSDAG